MDVDYINPDSDGKFYALEEMVRAGCSDCAGCHKCCCNMGESIVLDPFDLFQLRQSGADFEQLLGQQYIALSAVDGMILPHIRMTEQGRECPFLTGEKRCGIHSCRPGMCRLFPLGRNYGPDGMDYILLSNACEKKNRSKIKVSKWLGIEPAGSYHQYILSWHDSRRDVSQLLAEAEQEQAKTLNTYILQAFFIQLPAMGREQQPSVKDTHNSEFFRAFQQKLQYFRNTLGLTN